MSIPHPFPYQGSKRGIARHILRYMPGDASRLVEPFCGSAAVSIAAASRRLASNFWLNDTDPALMDLWSWILERPEELTTEYERLWNDQLPDRKSFFFEVRDEFNSSHRPPHLLYLLARIVKGSVRYSSRGHFNQSPDNRRSGMRPTTMRSQIFAVSQLLRRRTRLSALDFRDVIPEVAAADVVYMDPPYQGTSQARDQRYYDGLTYGELADALSTMNERGLSYMLSYDGRTGRKTHGKPLPAGLGLRRLDVSAGRSTQATLLGRSERTVESLYLSPALMDRLQISEVSDRTSAPNQMEFVLR